MRCSYCEKDIPAGVGLVVDIYHSLSGYEEQIVGVYCPECFRRRVSSSIPESPYKLAQVLRDLHKRQTLVRMHNLTARMRVEETELGRIEP